MSARPAVPALRRRDADRRFGIRLFGSAAAAAVAAVLFGLVLVLVESGWHPLRRLDAGAAGWLIGLLAKTVVERARPALPDPVAHAPGFSFPSGHAMTATTSFAILLLVLLPLVRRGLRPLLWAVAIVSVLGVGFTRVALGVHWFSDVAGGWTLGLAVVALTGWSFEAWRADAGLGHADVAEGLEPELSGDDPEATGPNP